jgi:putative CocE/NonD family hydrolase
MRDGVRLATDIYIPLVAGEAPYSPRVQQQKGRGRNSGNSNGISNSNGNSNSKVWPPLPGLIERAISLRDDPYGGVLVRRNSTYQTRRRYPVILERTPYNKCGESRSEFSVTRPRAARRSDIARHMCRRGYVVVMQDCRGKFASGGKFHKYVDEAKDGHDLMAWLVKQPWCDPYKIGTMGFSYDAHVQSALATSRPKGLACMYIDSGGFSSAYHNGIRRGGAFEMKQVTWAHKQALKAARKKGDEELVRALTEKDIFEWFRCLPWRRGHSPLTPVPEYEEYLFDEWQEGTFSTYYQQPGMNNEGYYDMFPDVPTAIVGSWQDPYVLSCLTNYVELNRRHESRVTLLMGPWTHGNRSVTYAGDVDFGIQSTLDGNVAEDYLQMRLDWFGRWLKNQRNGVDDDSRVKFYLMGGGDGLKDENGRMRHGGRWVHSDCWPPKNVVHKVLHLEWRDDVGVGRLSESVPIEEEYAEYMYDPKDPVPTVGGAVTSGQPIMVGGCFDQRVSEGVFVVKPCPQNMPLSSRSDVLVFESEILEHDVAVVGAVEVVLRVSSDCLDTDFTAKLIDLHPPNDDYPEGFAMNVADGIFRMRYREGWDHESFMTSSLDDTYEVTIRPSATANLFKAGHRIRLDVSSSNFPQFDINPNTAEPEGDWRTMRVATNRIHTGGGVSRGTRTMTTSECVVSHMCLPVLEIDGLVMNNRPVHL